MALPPNIGDREHRKFVEDNEGNVSLRIGPGAISTTEGNSLDITSTGRAKTTDDSARGELKEIVNLLKDCRYQLQLITGAEINE